VVNPAKEPGFVRFASPSDLRSMLKGGEPVASLYIQPHLGGDIALMHGLAKWLLENGYVDREFIRQHTTGFEAFAAAIAQLSWHEIVEQSGVDREQIVALAKVYSTAKHTIFSWSMGLTHHLHGVANIETVAALALLRGMIGKPGAGLLPLRGHSNIQGTGSMGFTPQLKAAMQQKIEDKLGFALPATEGLDTMGCMNASQRGDIDAAIMLGGNLLACNPDTEYAKSALNNIPFKYFINSSLNQSHVLGVDGETIVLPIKVRDEETQATTQESMFNFIRLSDGGIERLPSLLSEMDIICTLGTKLVAKDRFDFSMFFNHARVRAFVGDVAPGFGQLKNIDESKQEFHIEDRTLYEPVFNTADGKAQICFHFSPGFERKPSTYTLTSVRSEGQFNSIIYHENDSYRSQTERWVVMMNPEDMRAEGLVENQRVTLTTAIGKMENLKVKAFDIRRGNLMCYYPEANVLIPNTVDARSKTPGFKSVSVTVCANL
jgi:molybdopterin-dependent oxidoreductase alpha subunit